MVKKFSNFCCFYVALFARAWIEMPVSVSITVSVAVALFARAWIEIFHKLPNILDLRVALFARAWIEIERRIYRY